MSSQLTPFLRLGSTPPAPGNPHRSRYALSTPLPDVPDSRGVRSLR